MSIRDEWKLPKKIPRLFKIIVLSFIIASFILFIFKNILLNLIYTIYENNYLEVLISSIGLAIIFTMISCTFIIVDELRKYK